MRWLKRIGLGLLAVVAAACIGLAIYLHVPTGFDARLQKVARIAEAGVAGGHWPGMMWAVVAPGEVLSVGSAGFADLEAGREMSPDTPMPIGSISKVIVGLAGARAIRDGDLDAGAPIGDILSVPFDPPDGAARSFVDLATHRSGILDTDAGYETVAYHYGSTTHPVRLPEFLTRYLGEEGDLFDPTANFGDWAPGTVYAYSNIGAGLAAQVIADATGTDFAAYSAQTLATLGMSGRWGHLGPALPENARLYEQGDDGGFQALPPYGLATWPDGQFNASVTDLARLLATIMGDGTLDGAEVLDPALVAELVQPRVTGADGMAGPGDWIGLFWGRETLKFWPFIFVFEGHSGGDPGVVTFMYHPEGSATGFVLMLNGEPAGTLALLDLIRIARLLTDTQLPE